MLVEFETVAVKDWVAPVERVVAPGVRATPTTWGGISTFKVDVAYLLESDRLITVTK
jgi:hypothetical protein